MDDSTKIFFITLWVFIMGILSAEYLYPWLGCSLLFKYTLYLTSSLSLFAGLCVSLVSYLEENQSQVKYLIIVVDKNEVYETVYRASKKPTKQSVLLSIKDNFDTDCWKVVDVVQDTECTNYLIENEEEEHILTAKVYASGSISVV